MKPTKQNAQTPKNDDLDHLLDAALAQYAAAEPRMGLEERVFARLRSEALQPPRRASLWWGMAAGVAVIAVVAVLAWRSSQVPRPMISHHRPVAVQTPSVHEANPGTQSNQVAVVKHTPTRTRAARRAHESIEISNPKLDQFPSPKPLSTEEIALASYVKKFPKEAQLVAQAQEEFALETEKVMNDAGSGSRTSTSIQQER